MNNTRPRILLAKIGLDGHDRGVKVLAREFRDAGMEVIYTGLWQTCDTTVHAALQEDVDVIGVSLLSAAHMTVMPELLRLARELRIEDIPVVLGGIVPVTDHPALKGMGVAAVFNPGSSLDKIVGTLRELAQRGSRRDLADLLAGYQQRDARALARLITVLHRGLRPEPWTAPAGRARIIGITGAPGVGKSSFIGRLSRRLRNMGRSVAVVAIDPSSPITGGALLGDRLRMMTAEPDDDFFIRSLSSRDVQGGLAPNCKDIVTALSGFGFDYILVETVGAGQGDVAIRSLTDQTLLILMPESGDAIQFSKAGIVEIASGFVINKCDLPGADASEAQLRSVISDGRPFWRISSVREEGIDAVAEWVTRS